jgi:SAM-dependent methyltransferase
MEAEHYAALDQNDRAYWWFAVRYTVVRRLLRRRIPDGLDAGPGSFLLDVGCGTGGFLADILESGFLGQGQVLGIEPSPLAHESLERRGIPAQRRPIETITSDSLPRAPDAITLLDVLEHLPEPVAMLRQLHAAAPKGGRLIILVPAFPALWSTWDEKLGHFRRYTKARLSSELRDAGWRPILGGYIFGSMFLPALWRARLIKRDQLSDQEFPVVPPGLNTLLTRWYKGETLSLRWPLGTSVAMLAVKSGQ